LSKIQPPKGGFFCYKLTYFPMETADYGATGTLEVKAEGDLEEAADMEALGVQAVAMLKPDYFDPMVGWTQGPAPAEVATSTYDVWP
jgi:hypothetical protein